MNSESFRQYVEKIDTAANHVLGIADKEYADDRDYLIRFKTIADFLGITPVQVAAVYALKHIASIANGVSIRDSMDGRVMDARNYLYFMGALLDEPRQTQPVLSGRDGDN